jgi:Tol biopolymer transport system component
MTTQHVRWQAFIIVVATFGLLLAGLALAAQAEKPPSVPRQEMSWQDRFWSGDLPAASDTVSVQNERATSQSPLAATADWAYLVYQSYRDGNWEIYLVHDGQEFRLTNNPATDARPRLNRGSTKVAFNSNRDGNYEIYTMNIDGSNVKRLTNNTASDSVPAWSPDGTKIAFMSRRDGNYEIYVMNADGSGQTQLTNLPTTDDVTPVWSPDGNQIAWVQENGSYGAIDVMNANGSGQHQILGSRPYLADIQWSPAGNRFAFDAVPNGFSFSIIYVVNTDGSGMREVSSWAYWDYWVSSWRDSTNVMYTHVEYVIYNNQVYISAAYVESYNVDYTNAPYRYTSSGLDMNPDWQTADVSAPSSQVKSLPAFRNITQITVEWSGIDIGLAGIMSYDIQYRDGANGAWTDWVMGTAQTSAVFNGLNGHTYYFRSRARDYAGNLEAYPSTPDALTTIYQYSASGKILDNHEQPVAVTNIQASPAAINTGVSRHDGDYDFYFASGGVYTLTTTRINFGQLPPLLNVTVPTSSSLPTLYLPPLDDQISDSHFESGDLSAWNANGDLTPTITSTAHTGNYATLLGGSVPTDTLTAGPWHSTLEQTIAVSPTIMSGTLSLLYRVDTAEPLSDTLTAYVFGANNILTFTLPLTSTDWTHAWFDVSAWNEPTATVKIDFALADTGREARIILDEITWGSAIKGAHDVFLPIIKR